MGYSLQYCLNECGNAVPGNECDWEDGVCDACRERREDEAKGETMAGWTPKDTEALLDESHAYAEWAAELTEGGSAGTSEDARLAELFARAAAHIEALEARVAELEGPCSFCLETPGHGASKPICDGCAQLATDQAKTSRGLVERIATLEADQERLIEAIGCADYGDHGRKLVGSVDEAVGRAERTSRDYGNAIDRIATLEAERANAIPRAVLVGSLRKRLRQATAPGGASCSSDMRRDAIAETLRGLIREIERGEWPGEGER